MRGVDSVALRAGLCLALVSWLPDLARSQGSCDSDSDCAGKYPCCSDFGYCGDGPGYCEEETPIEIPDVELAPVEVPEEVFEKVPETPDSNTTTGCYLPHYEFVGGDIPLQAGGGGVLTDSSQPSSCQARCSDNPLCLWFTFQAQSKLCFLKSSRGFLRRRSESGSGGMFTSGATFKDGCVKDPPCLPPYLAYRHQCLYFPNSVSSITAARLLCYKAGGVLPYDFHGYHSLGDAISDKKLFWLNYNPESEKCFACRLGTLCQGVTPVPCETSISFACQRKPAFPIPAPPRPEILDSKLGSNQQDSRIRLSPVIPARRQPWSRRLQHRWFDVRTRYSLATNYHLNPYLRFWKGAISR